MTIIGVDEAGRGAWAGPIVAGAVLFYKNPPNGLKDSKSIKEPEREELLAKLQESAFIGIGIIGASLIDRYGLTWANKKVMEKAIQNLKLKTKFPPKTKILIDGRPLNIVLIGLDQPEYIIKGDQKIKEISAASIVAKVTRDRIMELEDRNFVGYGFKSNKGYGTAKHTKGLETLGLCKIHRRSYKPIKDLIKN